MINDERALLKSLCQSDSIKLGHLIIEFATPGIGHLLKSAGSDYVFFDMEHSAFDFSTLKQVARYFDAANLPMITRVPSTDYSDLARACDAGSEGVMVPMVASADQAELIVRAVKYPPLGQRGVALGIAHDNYYNGDLSVIERMQSANERNTVFCLIETAEGVRNVDAIAAVDGVDCLWIGHFDLTASLQIPGQFDHPDYLHAVDRVVEAAHKHGLSLGRLVDSVDEGAALYQRGFDFCCYSGDVWLLQQAIKRGLDELRQRCDAGAGS